MNPALVSPLPGTGCPFSRLRRVLIADASARVRGLILEFAEKFKDLLTVSSCTDGIEALVLGEDLRPDLVLVGDWLTGMSGREVAWRLANRYPDIRVVMVSRDLPSGDPPALPRGVSAMLSVEQIGERLPELIDGLPPPVSTLPAYPGETRKSDRDG